MRILSDCPDWRDLYVMELLTAKEELDNNNFRIDVDKQLIANIYSLPANHHQTFFARLFCDDDGQYHIVYAKPIQHSVWFSDLIYDYTFVEAYNFRTDPKRQGQIVCGMKDVDKKIVERMLLMFDNVSASQPVSAVIPDKSADFTGICVYCDENYRKELWYTDASLLQLSEDCVNPKSVVDYLNKIHFVVEEIIGLGPDDPDDSNDSTFD